jgi:hypothetical protein
MLVLAGTCAAPVIAIVLLVAPSARATGFELKNGDRLSGSIVKGDEFRWTSSEAQAMRLGMSS